MKGIMEVHLGDEEFLVGGGPYPKKPDGYFGVKLAPEVDGKPDVLVEWPDFGVPNEKAVTRALRKAIRAIARGEAVYVGCMGGIGRTGTFLALLAKVTDTPAMAGLPGLDPVEYVRERYLSYAVETQGQRDFIAGYSPKRVAWTLRLAVLEARVRAGLRRLAQVGRSS